MWNCIALDCSHPPPPPPLTSECYLTHSQSRLRARGAQYVTIVTRTWRANRFHDQSFAAFHCGFIYPSMPLDEAPVVVVVVVVP